MDYLVPGRQCGACKVCCIVPAIDKPEMQKQPGAVCRHCAGGACDIYSARPTVCRNYYCGWMRLEVLDDDWRPDKSGVLMEGDGNPALTAATLKLILVGNPLKTIRQQRFLDFVGNSLARNVTLYLSLPGPVGKNGGILALNTPEMKQALGQSRSQMRLVLEAMLKRLTAYDCAPYVMEYQGHDVSS